MTSAIEGPDAATVGAPLPGYELIGNTRTGPPDAIIAIEVWGRVTYREAIVRIISDAASEDPKPMNAGTVAAGGTDHALVLWTKAARDDYSNDWLDVQADIIKRRLAHLWGPS